MVGREKELLSNRLLLRCCVVAAAPSLLRFRSAAKQSKNLAPKHVIGVWTANNCVAAARTRASAKQHQPFQRSRRDRGHTTSSHRKI